LLSTSTTKPPYFSSSIWSNLGASAWNWSQLVIQTASLGISTVYSALARVTAARSERPCYHLEKIRYVEESAVDRIPSFILKVL
jgi:hypothetical protein